MERQKGARQASYTPVFPTEGALLWLGTALFSLQSNKYDYRSQTQNGSNIPKGSIPDGLPGIGRSPGVVLVPGVGASFLGVGVLDFSPGVDDLSFWIKRNERRQFGISVVEFSNKI